MMEQDPLKSRRNALLSDAPRIMVLVDYARMLYWAKSYVHQILGRPQKSEQHCWKYPNKEIIFKVNIPGKLPLKGYQGLYFTFGHAHSDAMLGIKR